MGITLANNAHTTLSADASSIDTIIYVNSVDSFPALDVGDYFYMTLERTSGVQEIVKVTQVNAASFTVVRGQEDTIAVSFSTGSMAKLNMTVQNVTDLILTGSNINNDAYSSAWDTDSADAPSRNAVYDKLETMVADSDIGVTVQAYDADLTTLGAGGSGARDFLGLGASNTVAFNALSITDASQNITLNSAGLTLSGPLSTDVYVNLKENGSGRWTWKYNASTDDSLELYNQGTGTVLTIGYGSGVFNFVDQPTYNSNAIVTVAGCTFTGDISVPDEAYGVGWNTSTEAPTKNAVYDKIASLAQADISGLTTASSPTFAGLSLASAGVINWNSGNTTLTHVAGTGLTVAGTGPGLTATTLTGSTSLISASASNGITITQAAVSRNHTNGSITFAAGGSAGNTMAFTTAGTNRLALSDSAVAVSVNLTPSSNDIAALGTSSLKFSDLFLASGGVINFNNGDVTLTHSAGALAQTGAFTAQSGTAIPAGGTTGAGIKVSSTANFGVFFGSGAPTLSAAKGSLYLRSDGSTVNDRMYVNTDGSTTWTAVVTSA